MRYAESKVLFLWSYISWSSNIGPIGGHKLCLMGFLFNNISILQMKFIFNNEVNGKINYLNTSEINTFKEGLGLDADLLETLKIGFNKA